MGLGLKRKTQRTLKRSGPCMKDPSLSWLLDPKDPSVRYQALIDLLHRPKDGKDVLAARDKIPSYGPVKKIIATQTSKGIWSPKETCYRPKWTSAVWPLE